MLAGGRFTPPADPASIDDAGVVISVSGRKIKEKGAITREGKFAHKLSLAKN